MTVVSIRAAEPEDVSAIRRVARDSWHAAYDAILGPETVEETVEEWYDRDRLTASVDSPDQPFYLASREGTVVGFLHAVPRPDSDDTYQLNRIYLDPDHWREGIGSRLLDRLLGDLQSRAVGRLRLVVLADNEAGRAFYEARGFERVGRQEKTALDAPEYVYVRDV
jgi:ribosomal protein S18 acetylase RimI-like enzyme